MNEPQKISEVLDEMFGDGFLSTEDEAHSLYMGRLGILERARLKSIHGNALTCRELDDKAYGPEKRSGYSPSRR